MTRTHVLMLAAVLAAFAAAPVAAQTAIEGEGDIDTVLLASTENYPDAMVAAPAAKKLGIPVLLTEPVEVPEPTRNALDRINPSEVVLVGGEAVIASSVRDALSEEYNVSRLWGTTRYGTAVEVAERFWVEGSDEAILIQNSLRDEDGFMLAAAKEIAREDMDPIYLTPDDGVPAAVLSSLESLGVEQVTVIGPSVSDAYRSSLNEIGVTVDEVVSGQDDAEVREHVQERLRDHVNASSRLLAVATGGFQHSISASSPEGFNVFQVTGDDDISDLVTLVNEKNITQVKVTGRPQLARDTADTLRQDTDATVSLAVARAAEAVAFNANISEDELEEYRAAHKQRMKRWQERRDRFRDHIRSRVNESINRADKFLNENSSEEARQNLREARVHYSDGNYEEARELAQEAINEERERRFEQRSRRGYEAVEEMMQEETQRLEERVQELREINQEFADEMDENMTVEERLETIQEFRDDRREVVQRLMEEARGRQGDIRERLRGAREAVRTRGSGTRFEFEAECTDETASNGFEVTRNRVSGHDGRVSVRGQLLMPTPNYRATPSFERAGNNTLDVTIALRETDGFGIQCVGVGEYRYGIDVAAGDWTVNVAVTADGSEVFSATETATVTQDEDDDDVDDAATERCMQQIMEAQAAAEGQVCTEQFQRMQCPHDDDVVHGAANGCEISALEELGWTAAGFEEDTETEDTDDTTAEHVIEYMSDGFTPSTITVNESETVTWVRGSDAPDLWVATDVHPSHEEWDGTSTSEHCPNDGSVFDQCETGDRYSFTFDKTGEWSYHNHMNSGHTGTVVVESNSTKTRR